tara:strand:+ start:1918 stop:2268 length:351 start_codon:yes stop_codon:yes gene_type:complete
MKSDLSKLKQETTEALQPGHVVLADTAAKMYKAELGGGFFAITALEDTVVDSSKSTWNLHHRDASGSGQAPTINNQTVDFTIPKGLTVYINVRTLTLVSGKCLLYARRNTSTSAEV